MRFFLLFVTIFFISPAFSATDDWTAYGKGSGGGHFSKADEIRAQLYETYKNTDGFLYISYAEENVFG